MKQLTMSRKLKASVLVMLLLIFLIFIGVLFIMKSFNKTTDKLVLEYHEMVALQELKMSLCKISTAFYSRNDSVGRHSAADIIEFINEAGDKLNRCYQVVTPYHSLEKLSDLYDILKKIESASETYHLLNTTEIAILRYRTIGEINTGIGIADKLIEEIQHEIEIHEQKSSTAIVHGSFTLISIGILLISILTLGGFLLVRNLTKPINQLVTATKLIGKGNRKLRVKVNSKDEFELLADSFNTMLDSLDKTTVSEKYLQSVIDSLFGALIVTDLNGNIKTINFAALKLFGYTEAELVGKKPEILFELNDSENEVQMTLDEKAKLFKNKEFMHSKNKQNIPVLVTTSILKTHENEVKGLIIVGYDLTEKHNYEIEIERIRKQQHIAINEAQENERMRIATDIHDGLGQMLTGVSYNLQQVNHENCINGLDISKVQQQIDAAIQEARNLAHNLIPIVLKDFGLEVALKNLVDKATLLNQTVFSFNAYDLNNRIDPKLEKAIYRICQEAINNIIKHAKATEASIQIFKNNDLISIVIDDNGVGFEADKPIVPGAKSGIGLISIKERVTSFDGTLIIDSKPN
jgi:PAS domain S-box-containing protein